MTLNSDYDILSPNDYQRMPWKNGLGETLEIQRYEDSNGLRFRLSQASVVEDGVFSDFSGLRRTLVLLSGNGITLTHSPQNNSHVLGTPLQMAHFSGGDITHATLKNGKIEDLNIMVRDHDTQAMVEAIAAPSPLHYQPRENTLFCGFYANEASELANDNGETLVIGTHCMMILLQDAHLELTKGSGVLITLWAHD